MSGPRIGAGGVILHVGPAEIGRYEVQFRDQQDRLCEITVTATGVPHALAVARDRLGDRASALEGAWRVTT